MMYVIIAFIASIIGVISFGLIIIFNLLAWLFGMILMFWLPILIVIVIGAIIIAAIED